MHSLTKIVTSRGWRPLTLTSCRCLAAQTSHLVDLSLLPRDDQIICQAREKLRMKKIIPNYIIKKSSIFLYEACTDHVDIKRFFEHLELDDTFNSWFGVTRLHVWMVMTRAMKDKTYGELLRNELCSRMWEDCTARIDKLGVMKKKVKKATLVNYGHEFNATIMSMDEGMLAGDTIMAGALWRTLFSMNKEVDAQVLELTIGYIRAQLEHLSRIKTDAILLKGEVSWKSYPPLRV